MPPEEIVPATSVIDTIIAITTYLRHISEDYVCVSVVDHIGGHSSCCYPALQVGASTHGFSKMCCVPGQAVLAKGISAVVSSRAQQFDLSLPHSR